MKKTIAFAGSSIIQGWTSLERDMHGLDVANIAIGGTTTSQWLGWISDKLRPIAPCITVFYCGSNDLNADSTPEAIISRTVEIYNISRNAVPGSIFFYVSVMKSPQKFPKWDLVDKINRELEIYSQTRQDFVYCDINHLFFGLDGNPIESLYQEDRLHLLPEAYFLMGEYMRPILMGLLDKRKAQR